MGTLSEIERRWNWRVSAHCRAISLVSLWACAFALSGPAFVIAPLVALRGAASLGQSVLNIRLGRRQPLARQTRLDWVLIGVALVATEAAAAAHQYGAIAFSPLVLLPIVAPFSAVQFRIWRRSMRAGPTIERATIVRLERFGARARAA